MSKPVKGYRFKGVPKVFADRAHAMMFLTNSPGYVSRQSDYLKTYWPGLAKELGLTKKKGGLLSGVTHVAQAVGDEIGDIAKRDAGYAKTVAHAGNKAFPAVLGLPPDYTVSNITQHPIRTYNRQAAKHKQLEKDFKAAYLAGDKDRMAALARESAQYDAIFPGPGIGGAKAAIAKSAESAVAKVGKARYTVAKGPAFVDDQGTRIPSNLLYKEEHLNLYDNKGKIVGSVTWDPPTYREKSLHITSVWIDPKLRGSLEPISALMAPILKQGHPIEARIVNPRLASLFEKMQKRGKFESLTESAQAGKLDPSLIQDAESAVAQKYATIGPGMEKPVEAIEELKAGLKGARSSYGKQKVKRSEEMSRRSAKVGEAFRTIADPAEAQAAARAALRGEHPKINFQGLKELTPENLGKLKSYAQHHETLLPFSKLRVQDALDNAVAGGQPTPSDLRLIEHVFGKGTANGIAEHAASWGDKAINALNIPRSLQSTLDVSGLTRQAFVAMTTHPIIWGKAAPSYIKAFRKGHYELIEEAVKNDPNYELALEGHVSFSNPYGSLLAHEEAAASDYAMKIPILGRLIKASAQGYSAFLNKLRMDLFSHFVRLETKAAMKKAGRDPHREDFLNSAAQIVNAATGRGAMHPRLEHMMPAANTLLYSPRLMLSRLNYFDPTWYVRLHSKRARIEALKGLFATTGYVTSVVTLLSQIPGVEVGSLNPLSSDFGKLRQGDTRVDVAAGFLQYIHLAAVLKANAKISTTTGKRIEFGSGFGQQTKWDQVIGFGTNKAAPPVSLGIGLLKGHDPVGNPMSLRHPLPLAGSLFVPLSMQDAKDLYRQREGGLDGITAASAGYGISAFGFGLQTYPDKAPKPSGASGGSSSGDSFWDTPSDSGSSGSSSSDSFWGTP